MISTNMNQQGTNNMNMNMNMNMNSNMNMNMNSNMNYMNQQQQQGIVVQQQPGVIVQQPMMMVQQPVIMQPGMMGYGMQIADPMDILTKAPVAKIIQEVELLEVMTGCETNNRYDIVCEIDGISYFCFRCKEDSSWCMRNCCFSDLRSFKIHMILPDQREFGLLDRPFKCTCCCCARPVVKGTFSSGQPFGTINQPFTCCSPFFDTIDETDGSKYSLEIDYCQCGFCCRSHIFGKCSEVYGKIYKENDFSTPVGTFKKTENCIQEMVSDANTFEITFPIDATVGDKLNLLATVILIDYRYYESNSSTQNQNRRGRRRRRRR